MTLGSYDAECLIYGEVKAYSRRRSKMAARRRRREAPMPASAAGLLRFFEEETKGIKVRPEVILIIAGLLIALTIIMNKFLA